MPSQLQLWQRYQQFLCTCPSIGLSLDISRMNFDDAFFDQMKAPMQRAFTAMDKIEAGAIANPDEQRMVGHYWLRDPQRARRRRFAMRSPRRWPPSNLLPPMFTPENGTDKAARRLMNCSSSGSAGPLLDRNLSRMLSLRPTIK